MAFCTNCGSTMDATAHFCTKCGKSVTPSATAPGAAAAPSPAPSYAPPAQAYTLQAQPASGGSNVLKIVLIVICAFVLLGVLLAAGGIYTAYRMRKAIHVAQDGRKSSVDFGGFKASTNKTDAHDLARKMGVDLYPGVVQTGDSAEVQFGNMITATIKVSTNDSVERVAEFYKSRYPKAIVSTQGSEHFTLVAGQDQGENLTINARDAGGSTEIEIAKVGATRR